MSLSYLVIDSKDRNTATSNPNSTAAQEQPWNRFTIQKPQNLLENGTKHIGVSEIRFPWYIPNITSRNNKIWVICTDEENPDPMPTPTLIQLDEGFYDSEQIISTLNTLTGIAFPGDSPSWDWLTTDAGNVVGNSVELKAPEGFYVALIADISDPTNANYYKKPSLAKTLGFTINQVTAPTTGPLPTFLDGMSTDLLYTHYVDIVSAQAHRNAHQADGNSSSQYTSNILCRVYCYEPNLTIESGQEPSVIYRQFYTPKMIKWRADNAFDRLDIEIRDEYGDPVWTWPAEKAAWGPYPDFQLTLVSSDI